MRSLREDKDYVPDMPPIECGEYLLQYLWEIGPTAAGAMAASPISHIEIAAWSMLVGIALQPWEARILRKLSREFAAELHRAEKMEAQAPWEPVDFQPDLAGTANSMRNAIARLAKQ